MSMQTLRVTPPDNAEKTFAILKPAPIIPVTL